LQYLRRFGRAEWDFVNEDKADAEKPLDDVADRYGLATWKCFYGDECGDGDGGVEHKKVMNKINSTYGDELLKEKGGVPHDYRSSLCYHYPWVPFRLTINRDEEETDKKGDADDKEVRYEIYDGTRDALVAEGEVVDDKIEDLFPDVEDPVIFIDGVRVWLRPELPEVPVEEVVEEDDDMTPMITDMYWTYGKDHIRLEEDMGTRYYADLHLHVETKNYDDDVEVEFIIKNSDGRPLFGDTSEYKMKGIIFDNKIIFEDPFQGYTLNLYPQEE
jgi:hypothetical protein